MSEENTENAQEQTTPTPTEGDAPTTEEAPAEKTPQADPEPEKTECPSSPTKEHDMFHNQGTGEIYCRYCGKTG